MPLQIACRGRWRPVAVSMVLGALMAVTGFLGHASAQQPRFPRSCCGEYDCLLHPVPRSQIERREDGWWLIKERLMVPFDQVRPSPDAGIYICRTQMGLGTLIHPPGEKPCLFMPPVDG